MPNPLLAWLGLLFVATLLDADTVVLSPVADTTLYQGLPGNNLGAELTLISGTTASGNSNRALLKFDVASGVSARAIVTSVTLTVTVARAIATQPSQFTLHRIGRGWGEGTGMSGQYFLE